MSEDDLSGLRPKVLTSQSDYFRLRGVPSHDTNNDRQ